MLKIYKMRNYSWFDLRRSSLVIAAFDDLAANLFEKLSNWFDVLVCRSIRNELAVWESIFESRGKGSRNSTVCCQVRLVSYDHNKEILLMWLQMLSPLCQLIKWVLIIDRVDEDADSCIFYEHVHQVVHLRITGRIPDIELKSVRFTLTILNVLNLGVVLNHFRVLRVSTAHWRILHKRVNNRSLPHTWVAHENDLGWLDLRLLLILDVRIGISRLLLTLHRHVIRVTAFIRKATTHNNWN